MTSRSIWRTPPRIIVLTVMAIALVGAGTALAVEHLPDSEVIHGCHSASNGLLRVTDSASDCRPGEVPISWNQQGPEGPEGAEGPRGEVGPAGAAGPVAATRWVSRWEYSRLTTFTLMRRVSPILWVQNPADPALGSAADAHVSIEFRSGTDCVAGARFGWSGAFVQPGRLVGNLSVVDPSGEVGSGCLEVTSTQPVFVMGHIERGWGPGLAEGATQEIVTLEFFPVPLP